MHVIRLNNNEIVIIRSALSAIINRPNVKKKVQTSCIEVEKRFEKPSWINEKLGYYKFNDADLHTIFYVLSKYYEKKKKKYRYKGIFPNEILTIKTINKFFDKIVPRIHQNTMDEPYSIPFP